METGLNFVPLLILIAVVIVAFYKLHELGDDVNDIDNFFDSVDEDDNEKRH